jgi:hypothetical protein
VQNACQAGPGQVCFACEHDRSIGCKPGRSNLTAMTCPSSLIVSGCQNAYNALSGVPVSSRRASQRMPHLSLAITLLPRQSQILRKLMVVNAYFWLTNITSLQQDSGAAQFSASLWRGACQASLWWGVGNRFRLPERPQRTASNLDSLQWVTSLALPRPAEDLGLFHRKHGKFPCREGPY